MKQEPENPDMRQKAGELAASFISRMGWDVPFYSDPRWAAAEAGALAVCLHPPDEDYHTSFNLAPELLLKGAGEFEKALAKAVALVLWTDLQEKRLTSPGLQSP